MSATTRTPKAPAKPAAKKTAARRTTKKTTAAPAADPRPNLPTRDKTTPHGEFITETQIRAAYTAALAGVTHTRIAGWQHHADETVTYAMPTGAALAYNPATHTLTAYTPCAGGYRHPHTVTTPADLHAAQNQAAACTGHGHTRRDTSNEETQATDVTTLRAAHDEPQEHPHG